MDAMRVSGSQSLSRYPRAPARNIGTAASTLPRVVSATTLTSGFAARMRRVASIPSMTGMWMSMRTTSGFKRAAASTPSAPFSAISTTTRS